MIVKINGMTEEVRDNGDVASLLAGRGISCDRVVVELNKRIIPREELARTIIGLDDELEIVTFVGGG